MSRRLMNYRNGVVYDRFLFLDKLLRLVFFNILLGATQVVAFTSNFFRLSFIIVTRIRITATYGVLQDMTRGPPSPRSSVT